MRELVRDEHGGGGVAGLALIGAIAMMVAGLAPVGGAVALRQRTIGVADAAALAAADTASGRLAGSPCDSAELVAAQSGAGAPSGVAVDACSVDDGGVATIVVSSTVLGIRVSAEARAGPEHGSP